MSSEPWQGCLRHKSFPAVLGVHRKLRHAWQGEMTDLLKGFGGINRVPGHRPLAKAIALAVIPSGTLGQWYTDEMSHSAQAGEARMESRVPGP